METVVTCGLLLALAVVCLQSFLATTAQRRVNDQRQIALQETSNLMEQFASVPWEELDRVPERPFVQAVRKSLEKELDDAELTLEVVPVKLEPDAKRLVITLRWKDKGDQWVQPVRLTAWRYR